MIVSLIFLLAAADSTQPPSVEACRAELRRQALAAGITAATFDSALKGVTPDSTVLRAAARQPEFVTPVWDYLAMLVDSQRVADGLAGLARWDSVLRVVEARYGVDRHVIVAVWGVESDYGRLLGDRPVVRSLITGACFGARRQLFREQLLASLTIIQRGDLGSEPLLGSWAGAIGQTQFMPTTYLSRAVDQDGDGRRDLIRSTPDALASTANYLKHAGWRGPASWGSEVRLPKGYRGPSGRTVRRPWAFWAKRGITRLDRSPLHGTGQAALLLPAGRRGPAFLVSSNFDAIYAYNAAESYALAIGHLADRLGGAPPIQTPWPTKDRGLSRAERREVQQRLLALGYPVGTPDGTIGSRTRAAIRAYQAKQKMVPDGRAGGLVLDRLRNEGS